MSGDELELSFVEMTFDDIPALTAVMTRAFDEDSRKHLGVERGGPPGYDTGEFLRHWVFDFVESTGYKVEAAGQIVGGLIVWVFPNGHNSLGTIFVDPAYQDHGVGTRMWKWIESTYPATSWQLDTPIWATKNHHFYEQKCGFTRIEVQDDQIVYRKVMAAQ